MSYGFPNWMFAAVAIAAYEIGGWLKGRLHAPWIMWAAYGIIAICAIWLCVRFLIRWFKRDDEDQEPEDWRQF